MSRRTPSLAKLIALLIEERAKVLGAEDAVNDHLRDGSVWRASVAVRVKHRDQARREIEAEVLTPTTRSRQ